MNEAGSASACFWREFQMREFAFEAAKWSPWLLDASASIIRSKILLTKSMMSREDVGKKCFRMKTPGPVWRIECHSSWRMETVGSSPDEYKERS